MTDKKKSLEKVTFTYLLMGQANREMNNVAHDSNALFVLCKTAKIKSSVQGESCLDDYSTFL